MKTLNGLGWYDPTGQQFCRPMTEKEQDIAKYRYAKTPLTQSTINIAKIYTLFKIIGSNPAWYQIEYARSLDKTFSPVPPQD